GLTVTGITTSGVTLNWTAVSGAISYSVQHRRTGATSWITASATSTSLVLTGLTASSAYEFQVQTVCSASSGAYSSAATFTTSGTSGGAIPVPDHIVICMFENHAYSQIIGNSAAPHINALANDVMSANFTESYGLTHPSQPNYLMFFAGGNQGVTNNALPAAHFTSMNLAKALENAGRTFVMYSEGLPSVGYDGEASGNYVRRHNPIANWMGSGTNQVSSTLNQPYTAFPTNYSNLPTVSFVVPDLVNGMHDGTGNTAIATGDNWYFTHMEPYVQWARTHNSLFILTFDEDDNLHSNQIPTIFSGQMVVQGQYNTGINHYNVLRTIEDMYGLVHSGAAASATPIHGCWTTGFRMDADGYSSENSLSLIYPNPVEKNSVLGYELASESNVSITISGLTGNLLYAQDLGSQTEGEHEFLLPLSDLNLRKGIYFLELQVNEQRFVKRFIKAED
ncbi:MAG: T9SS type A sorting domain-containing protein, partial [Bacteroidia bacterium]|nr:T9SS type A sorting domain-containing protein [Bacteroidia bacterium]